jgi:hypothetical protein
MTMTEFEILLGTIAKRTGYSENVISSVFDEAKLLGWELQKRQSIQLPPQQQGQTSFAVLEGDR